MKKVITMLIDYTQKNVFLKPNQSINVAYCFSMHNDIVVVIEDNFPKQMRNCVCCVIIIYDSRSDEEEVK
jgi:hypothetical protein